MAKVMRINLDKFVSQIYMPYCKLVKRSWQVDERIARHYLSPVFGAINLCELLPQQIARWFYALSQKGLAPVTCNRILATFRAICGHAVKLGFLQDKQSLFSNVKAYKIKLQKQRILTREEAKLLMMNLQKDNCLASYALRLLMLTGARKNEILRAKWEEIDKERHILIVPLSKSGKTREIILSSDAWQIIKELRKNNRSPWLFPGRGDGCLSDIYQFWNRLRNRLGLGGMRIHDLRHSFASFLVNDGYTLFETQILLGHANPRTTMRYASLRIATLLRAVASVQNIYSPTRHGIKDIFMKLRDFIWNRSKRESR